MPSTWETLRYLVRRLGDIELHRADHAHALRAEERGTLSLDIDIYTPRHFIHITSYARCHPDCAPDDETLKKYIHAAITRQLDAPPMRAPIPRPAPHTAPSLGHWLTLALRRRYALTLFRREGCQVEVEVVEERGEDRHVRVYVDVSALTEESLKKLLHTTMTQSTGNP